METTAKKNVIVTSQPHNVMPKKGGCIVVVRGEVKDDSTLIYPCQFCDKKFHTHGYYEGCQTPTYRSSHCLNLPKGTEVLIHF